MADTTLWSPQMPLVRNIPGIHDDQFAEGANLAFPDMTSCSAVICVLPGTLIGVHKTMGWTARHNTLFGRAQAAIGARVVSRVYIAGWNVPAQHNPAQIRAALGLPLATRIYTSNYTHGHRRNGNPRYNPGLFRDYVHSICTFASFRAANTAPRVGIKRDTKVASGGFVGPWDLYRARQEHLTTPGNHLHQVAFRRA